MSTGSPYQLAFAAEMSTRPAAPRRRQAWSATIVALFGPRTTATELKGEMAICYDTAGEQWCIGHVPTRATLAHASRREIAREAADLVHDLLASQDPRLPPALADVQVVTAAHVARLEAAHAAADPARGAAPEAMHPWDNTAPVTEPRMDPDAAPALAAGEALAPPLLPALSLVTAEPATIPFLRAAQATPPHEPAPLTVVPDAPPVAVPGALPEPATASEPPPSIPPAPAVTVAGIAETAAPGGQNYRLAGDRPLARGWHARALDNLTALRLVKALEEAGRPATPAEQDILIRYVGWGATELAQRLFPTRDAGDEAREAARRELQEVLTPEEYAAAKSSTQYAHYTPEVIARCLGQGLVRLGFRGGRVLEPGVGTGLFLATVPDALREGTRFTGTEKDLMTARIARLLFPLADIRCEDFAASALPASFDLAIGNPPYADLIVRGDPAYRTPRFRLHDYFFAKALDRLKPGGLLAFLTSRGTLDKEHDAARGYLAARADLVGAIRLPRGAFAATAGTEVVADIVILRRRAPDERPDGPAWAKLVALPGSDPETPIRVNEYVAAHPAMVLGRHQLTSSRFGPVYTVDPLPDQELGTALAAALDRLPAGLAGVRAVRSPAVATASVGDYTREAAAATVLATAPVEGDTSRAREGSYLLGLDGALLQLVGGTPTPVPLKTGGRGAGMYPAHARIVRQLIPIRDAVREILRLQVAGQSATAAQARLRSAYDAFVSLYGPINKIVRSGTAEGDGYTAAGDEATWGIPRTPNLTPFLDDPDAYLVASIEEYSEETGVAQRGPIFTAQVIAPPVEPAITSAFDALHVVLSRLGRVDIPAIAALLGWEDQAVINDRGDTIYRNPATEAWETADAYLSGAVRTKLALAQSVARADPQYARNVAALERVQPADLNPSDITVRLGAPWIPTDVVEAFVRAVLGSPCTVRHIPEMGLWSVEGTNLAYTAQGTSKYGTERRNAAHLLDDALNARLPQLYDTVDDGHGGETRVLNTEATEAAREKLARLRQAFGAWIWADPDRALRLVRLYNDQYNNLVPRAFDGAHLTLPGASGAVTLYPHQKRAIWRIIATGTTYLAHAAGAGKTISCIAAIMEQKRLGLSSKALVVVPNHCLKQWAREFMLLYPNARILVADEVQFHRQRRQHFLARAATGTWDAIIITHSGFKFIPAPPGFEERLTEETILDMEALVATASERITRKEIERAIETMKERLASLRTRKDDLVDIAESGVTQLVVDEAHEFRKLSFATRMGALKGIDPVGSQRAWDLWVKSRYVEQVNPGRALVAASGTPITNTMGELFTVQRYMAEEALRARNLHVFDSWAALFGESRAELELQPNGPYKSVTRFAQFINLPELIQLFRAFADVLVPADLRAVVHLPCIAGGRRQLVRCPASPAFKAYQAELDRRIAAIEARHGPPATGDDILLAVMTDGRHAALDLRLVRPDAGNVPTNKVNTCIATVLRLWQETAERVYHRPDGTPFRRRGAAQMIFSDLGTPAAADTRKRLLGLPLDPRRADPPGRPTTRDCPYAGLHDVRAEAQALRRRQRRRGAHPHRLNGRDGPRRERAAAPDRAAPPRHPLAPGGHRAARRAHRAAREPERGGAALRLRHTGQPGRHAVADQPAQGIIYRGGPARRHQHPTGRGHRRESGQPVRAGQGAQQWRRPAPDQGRARRGDRQPAPAARRAPRRSSQHPPRDRRGRGDHPVYAGAHCGHQRGSGAPGADAGCAVPHGGAGHVLPRAQGGARRPADRPRRRRASDRAGATGPDRRFRGQRSADPRLLRRRADEVPRTQADAVRPGDRGAWRAQ